MPKRLNPVTGYHPELLPRQHRWPEGEAPAGAGYAMPRQRAEEDRDPRGESPIFVPLASLTEEEIVQLPVRAFTPDEWNQLDEDQQEAIFENDASSQERITEFVDLFVAPWKWEQDPNRADYSEIEDSFESWLADQGDRLWQRMPDDELEGLLTYASERGLDVHLAYGARRDPRLMGAHGDDLESAINSAMENSNRYEIDMDADDPIYSEERHGHLYVEPSEYRTLYDALTASELERAIAMIAEQTDNTIDVDADRLAKNRPIEQDWDTGVIFKMKADWDTISQEVRQAIDELAPRRGSAEVYEAIADKPPEERVVHRWPDGFYVQDLLAEELKAEGEAMGMCVGRPDMGYDQAVRNGEIKIMSLRRPSGKPLFTFELQLDDDGKVVKIEQIKGKANRLPGFDRGKLEAPIKRDEIERVLEFVEGPLIEYEADEAGRRRGEGIAFEDIDDLKPAAKQVWALYKKRDPWATRLLVEKLQVESGPHRLPPVDDDAPGAENPAKACRIHGAACGGFCTPYRRRR